MMLRFSLLIFTVAVCIGCQSSTLKTPSKIRSFQGIRMCIAYKVLVGDPLGSNKIPKIQQIIDETFDEIDAIYNEWNPNSEVSRLNTLKAGTSVKISAALECFLSDVGEAVALTGGLFDPTVEPLVRLWKNRLEAGTIPTQQEIDLLIPAIGWSNIHYGEGLFSKEHDATSFTFGGIAKGLLVDMLIEKLHAAHLKNLYVEWGGEIRTAGQHPEGRPWHILVTRRGTISSGVETVTINEGAIATSGNYHQQWTVRNSDKVYTHIIDPRTYYPLTVDNFSISSATVIARSCSLADALATTVMLFNSMEEAQSWALEIQEKIPDTQFWLFTHEEQ